jgi:hypothetical protein
VLNPPKVSPAVRQNHLMPSASSKTLIAWSSSTCHRGTSKRICTEVF